MWDFYKPTIINYKLPTCQHKVSACINETLPCINIIPTRELRISSCHFQPQTCEFRIPSCNYRLPTCDFRPNTCEFRPTTCDFKTNWLSGIYNLDSYRFISQKDRKNSRTIAKHLCKTHKSPRKIQILHNSLSIFLCSGNFSNCKKVAFGFCQTY